MSPKMRLRTRIQAPARFEDEDYDTVATNNATKPAFPGLLNKQAIAFDPHLPPATFPSLTQAQPQAEDQDHMFPDTAEPAGVDMMDGDPPFEHTFLPVVHGGAHPNIQTASANCSEDGGLLVFGRSFLDEVETSDEDEEETHQDHAEPKVADGTQSVHWTQLAPSLQVEILENLYGSHYGHAIYDILGLDRYDLRDGLKNMWARNRQIVAEEQGVRELQETQLTVILRRDHAARLTSDSWRDHVACTRRHLPHISARYDYFISNAAEVELAKRFLNEHGIDTCVLGDWGRYKKHYNAAISVKNDAEQVPDGGEGIDSGYTSGVAEQDTRRSSRDKGAVPLRSTLSPISNTARAMHAPSSLPLLRHQSMPDDRRNTGMANADNGITPGRIAKSPASAGLQVLKSSMKLRVRRRLTQDSEDAIALIKTRGGGLNDSDGSYDDENEELEPKSQQRLKTNEPKALRGREDAKIDIPAPGHRRKVIVLGLSPAKLRQIQTTRRSNARLSTVGSPEVLTPLVRTTTPLPANHTPTSAVSRPRMPMPAARTPVTWHGQHKSNAFSLKLLEIQRGASGLNTVPERPVELHQPLISPKRLKLNPAPSIISNKTSRDKQSQRSHGLTESQRKDSVSSQDAPPWSPLTQRSNSFSRPASQKEVHLDEPLQYETPSANSSDLPFQSNVASETKLRVSTDPASLMTQPAMTSYLKPTINANGSPVVALPLEYTLSSGYLSNKGTNHGTTPEFHPDSSLYFVPPQSPWKRPSHLSTPTHTSEYGGLAPTDPLRTYANNSFEDSPQHAQSSPSRHSTENLAKTGPETSGWATAPDSTPPSTKPNEQSVQALLSSFSEKPDTAGRKSSIHAGEPFSIASPSSSKMQSLTEEDASPIGGPAPSAKKAGESVEVATLALQNSLKKKKGKDGKGRPILYMKSMKQKQKEAANAAARAIGRIESAGSSRSTEGHKINTKVNTPPWTPEHESSASQTLSHIGTEISDCEKVSNSVQAVEIQKVAHLRSTDHGKDRPRFNGSTVKPLDVVAPSELKTSGAGNLAGQMDVETSAKLDSDQENGVFETSLLYKNMPTPKGKKVAVDRAKSALQSYQAGMPVRRKTGNPVLVGMASKTKSTPRLKIVGSDQTSALLDNTTPKPSGAADEEDEIIPVGKTLAKAGDVESHERPLSSQTTAKLEGASNDGEPSTPLKAKKTIKSGPTRESSVLMDKGKKKPSSFRGNQYRMADRTPRLNQNVTPVTKKSFANRGQQ